MKQTLSGKTLLLAEQANMTHQGYVYRFKKWGYDLTEVCKRTLPEIQALWEKCTLSPQYYYKKSIDGYFMERHRYGKAERHLQFYTNMKIDELLRSINSVLTVYDRIKSEHIPQKCRGWFWCQEYNLFRKGLENWKYFSLTEQSEPIEYIEEYLNDIYSDLLGINTARKNGWVFEKKEGKE